MNPRRRRCSGSEAARVSSTTASAITLQSKPGDVLIATHRELEERTKSGLAQATARAAEGAAKAKERLPVSNTAHLRDLVTTALQVNATTGNGFTTLVLPEPRLVTFKITGNGPVTAGAITIECCLQNTPIAPGSGSAGAMVWTALTTIAVPANATTDYLAGRVSGIFRARVSTPVTGGTVTVLAIGLRSRKAGAAAHCEF
jgi:hypothetical protein